MTAISKDLATLARASWAVASSDTMLRYGDWMEWSEAHREDAPRENPAGDVLEREIAGVVRQQVSAFDDTLPWSPAPSRATATHPATPTTTGPTSSSDSTSSFEDASFPRLCRRCSSPARSR
jgi:hypothetical protein